MQRHYATHGPPLSVCVRMVAIAFGVMKPPKPKSLAQEPTPDFADFMAAIAPGGQG